MLVGFGLIPVLMVVGVIAAMIVAVVFGSKAAKQRRVELMELSSKMGLDFVAERDPDHDERYGHFGVFSRGHGRSAYNTMRGTVVIAGTEMACVMGDYTYKTREGSGKNRRTVTHRLSYCIIEFPWVTIPNLLIRREGVFDKLGSAFGYDDIDFESHEFSKKFFVKSPNRKFAYDICHQRMIEWFLESEPELVDIERGQMCVTDGGRVWKTEKFGYTVDWIDSFVGRWPDFVVEDLEEGMLA